MKEIFRNDNGHVLEDENLVEVFFQGQSCLYPKQWFHNEFTNPNTPEFYAILIQELSSDEELHVSAHFYRALKKYCFDKDFECLLKDI